MADQHHGQTGPRAGFGERPHLGADFSLDVVGDLRSVKDSCRHGGERRFYQGRQIE